MKPLKALVVEDSETDEELLLRQLAKADYDVQSIRVQTATDMKRALAERDWDIVLSDFAMPGFTGLDALRVLQESGRDIPLIIISGTIGEDVAVEAMRSGVNDYLIKGNLTRLAPAIERELENAASRQAQKRAEESLRRSESRMRALLDAIPDLMFRCDKAGKILDFNATHQENLLVPPSEFIGKNLSDVMPPPVTEQSMRHITLAVETGAMQIFEYQLEVNRIEKSYEARIVAAGDNEVTAIIRDITERKQVEDKLRRSEASLANAQRLAHIGNWELDIENNKVFWSDEIYRIFGLTENQFDSTRESFFERVHPDDRQMVQATAEATLARNTRHNFEYRIVRPDGEERIVSEIGEILFDESGKPLRFVGTGQDITERKAAEAEMRLMKSAIDSIAEGVSISDAQQPDNPIIYINTAFENLTGYAFEEIKGRNCRFLQGAETNSRTVDRIREALEKETAFRGEILNYHKNGESLWNELKISPVFDAIGRLTNFVAVQQDISERKRAEQLLIESEEKYRSIVETANEGIWLTDAATRTTYVNRQMAQMLGYTVDEMLGRPIFDFIFDEDLPAAKHKFAQRLIGESETGEFRMRRKNGSEIITLYNTTPRRNQVGEIIGFLSMRSDITESKKVEKELQHAEAKYRSLVESSPAIVYLAEPQPPFSPIYVSPNISRFGYTPEEWFSRPDLWLSLIHEEDRARVLQTTEAAMSQDSDTDLEYRIVARDGAIFWLHDKGRFVSDREGNKTGWQGIILDITATKKLEEQFRQAQKLESVGLLAGGIAHDFNNMLTVINGYSDLALRRLKDDPPLRRNIEEIKKAGLRSAALTQQLLAFSRQQVLQPVVLDLNAVIADTLKMLARLINEDIQLIATLNPQVGRVMVDPGQFSQIIMNLAVNARDAMPQGGKLIIETANVFLDPADARQHVGVLPGAYVLLAVSDTGSGMSDEIRAHIFEPFFTTKKIGHGTGLGLATVYGIVKQSGGSIEVDSEQGVGTTFKIYLPRAVEQADAVKPAETFVEKSTGTETILLVEDEELVRNLSKEILATCGYTVIEAENGQQALEICAKGDYQFDLLMTDVVMPKMNGRELAEKLATRLPNLRILFTSGYTDDAVVRHGVIETNTNFIQKPFTFETLTGKVRELLDS